MPDVWFRRWNKFTPLPLERVREPFDDPRCVFELKHDGFRGLALLEPNRAALVSRNGNPFDRLAPLAHAVRDALDVRSAVLDGEVVVLDAQGRARFNDLLFGRGVPIYAVFDLLAFNGRDLRALPLLERKRRLRRLIPQRSECVLYVDHVVGTGRALFALICDNDLEGIVAKRANAPYALVGDRSPWTKIKYRDYSQARDRHELFAR